MARGHEVRISDVRAVLEAAGHVHDHRGALVDELVATTGLTPEGVELGFASLEREADDDDLRRLVQAAGVARHVHVVLSANVFVAPLRALALARAAAERVTIRPSSRDPVVTRALVHALSDPRVTLVEARDAAATGADMVSVYGRDETIARVRDEVRRAPSGPKAVVIGHGAGLGVALVTTRAPHDAASLLALDVAAFDQRGCLSPRIALVEGRASRARTFASELHAALDELDRLVPRGRLWPDELVDAARWRDAVAFAGELWTGKGHTVGLVAAPQLVIPPPGRHLQVVAVEDAARARRLLAPIAHLIVTVGSDDSAGAAALGLPAARLAALGRMQRPPLDGPVDRRTATAVT